MSVGAVYDLLIGRPMQRKADNAAIHKMLLGMEQQGPTRDGSPNYGSNNDLVNQVRALQEAKRPGAGLELLVNGTSPAAKRSQEIDKLRQQLLGQQNTNAQTQGSIAQANLERLQSGYQSPLELAQIDNLNSQVDLRNAQTSELGAPPSEYDRRMAELKMLEQEQKAIEAQQANEQRLRDQTQATVELREAGKEEFNKAIAELAEAESAIANVDYLFGDEESGLIRGERYKDIYGGLDSRTWTMHSESVSSEAKIKQLANQLALLDRQKLKGQGNITEGETGMVKSAGSTLVDPVTGEVSKISEPEAEAELIRVRDRFSSSKHNSLEKIFKLLQSGQIHANDMSQAQWDMVKGYIQSRGGDGVN